MVCQIDTPSGKHTKNYGKSHFFIGKSTISMAIFNSYVKLPEGTHISLPIFLVQPQLSMGNNHRFETNRYNNDLLEGKSPRRSRMQRH